MYVPAETDQDLGVIGPEEWSRQWAVRKTDWHQPVPNRLLLTNADRLLKKESARVFVPLCGKSLDLIWLYEKGHSVVGVELAEAPIKELFTESNWPFTVEKLEGIDGSVYVSQDTRMKIYVADLFYLNEEILGKFDAIWDRASLVAINVGDQARYRDLMLSLMTEDTQYLLETMEYDENMYPGPPHSMKVNFIQELYGEKCTVELIFEQDGKAILPFSKDVDEADQSKTEAQNKGDVKNYFRKADETENNESTEAHNKGDDPEIAEGEKKPVVKQRDFSEVVSMFSFLIVRLFAIEFKKGV